MTGTAVIQESPVHLALRANQVQATGSEDVAMEVVLEEAITIDVAVEAESSTAQHAHHQSETSRGGVTILAWS